MKQKIPLILLCSRLVFAFIVIALTLFHQEWIKYLVIVLMYAGLLSDILDGIIARRLNISTEQFRQLDTIIDLTFYMSLLFYIFYQNTNYFFENSYLIVGILVLEVLMYLISWFRFRKFPSPHAILSKFWGLYLFIEFTLILLGVEGWHFRIALCFGLVAHIDRVLIYSILGKWEHDIPSCYHAYLLRRGVSIKKNKLFNG
ncbi:MAG: CDP-alcohol phosphatidyltransferase family protein [Bacteroidia bacterium]